MSSSRPLEIYMLPFLSPGHMIPLSEIGQLFSSAAQNVTILTTPHNASALQKSTTSPNFCIQTFPFPSKQVGLPDGLENFLSVTDIPTATKLYTAMTLLQSDLENFMLSRPPDVIISDMFFPWTADFAIKIGVPRIVFHATCIFAQTLKHAVREPDSPHRKVESDYEPFVIPNLPHKITMTRSQLPDYVRTPNGYTQLMEQWREAELKSYGIVVNNFSEFESEYIDYYKEEVTGGKIKIFHVGPTSIMHSRSNDKANRVHKTVITETECLSWLSEKKPNSVVYVCFGSACIFPDTQLMEIACALESCGYDFMWVVLGKDGDNDDDMIKWTPSDFNRNVIKTKRGLIIKGWAPQVLILDHASVGGFMSHCGGNSVIESVSCGVPMVTWPLYAEHFYLEKMLTQVYGIGVEVGVEDWNLWVDCGKKIIKREKIEKALRKLMDGEDEMVKEMRRKIKELGEVAKKAVQVGGSSHKNLMVLIEELKQIRDQKIVKFST